VNTVELSKFELERVVLQVIQSNPSVVFVADDVHAATLTYHVRERLPENQTLTNLQVAEIVWSLISQGLVFINFNNQYASNWRLQITDRGAVSLQDNSTNPEQC
jgi:hypothetical protein